MEENIIWLEEMKVNSSQNSQTKNDLLHVPVGFVTTTHSMAEEEEAARVKELEAVRAKKFAHTLKVIKRAVLEIQWLLLDGVDTDEQLHAAGELLVKSEYADVVTERAITKLCGYSRCANGLGTAGTRKGRYRISLSAKKVYDLQEASEFCCPACLIASKEFAGNLRDQRDPVEASSKVAKTLKLVRGSQYGKPSRRVTTRSRSGSTSPSSASSGKHQKKAAKKPQSSLTIIERAVGEKALLPIFDYGGPSDAVEGYVPARSRGGKAYSEAKREISVKDTDGEKKSPSSSDLPLSSTKKLNPNSKTEDNDDFMFSINMSGGRSEIVGSPCKIGQNGGKALHEWEPLISATSVTSVDTDSCVDSFASMSLDSNASSSNTKGMGGNEIHADLKSALKKEPGSHKHVHSVSWADQSVSLSITDTSDPEKLRTELPETSIDIAKAARFASAEAIAAALTEAATAAAAGELDGSEAVARAGIRILSASHNADSELSGNAEELDGHLDMPQDVQSQGVLDEEEMYARAMWSREEMRWSTVNRKQNGEDDEEDEDDVDYGDEDTDDTDDTEGFEGAREVGFEAPPKGFKAEVSMFGTIFMALEGWISAAAVAHIYGKEPHEEENFSSVNGREYSRQVVIGDGVSTEILRTYSLCVSRALPEVVRALRISVPMSTLELAIGRLVKTMSFVGALPPLGTKQWRMVVMLLLDGLSVIRLPWLGAHLLNNRAGFSKVLESTGTTEAEYDVFRDLLLPLGRLPTFLTLSGG